MWWLVNKEIDNISMKSQITDIDMNGTILEDAKGIYKESDIKRASPRALLIKDLSSEVLIETEAGLSDVPNK
nr:unnamed protein product [Callosobruchus analis]